MYLNLKTEYSIGAVFAPVEKVVAKVANIVNYAGIADLGNTYGHVAWDKACKKYGIKPIFGVQLPVVSNLELKGRNFPFQWMTFLARNNQGLEEIYSLVDIAHKQFYWLPLLSEEQYFAHSENLFSFPAYDIRWLNNYYVDIEDKFAYEVFAEEFKLERKVADMHIPSLKLKIRGVLEEFAILFIEECNATLPKAPMVKWEGKESLGRLCDMGARKLFGLNWTQEYSDRLQREFKVIQEKNFQDYFLVVADLVRYAKTKMLVGPARGSAAGSLVCYLLGITEVDPIKYGLYFERFVDLNRSDLPDIDIDFPDDKRHLVLQYLEKKYGKDNVVQIANIGRLKPKSALNRVAKNLGIPLEEIEEIKNISENLKDTFENSEIGKAFIEKYPSMKVAADLEGHTSYIGKHAAGILVCNEPVKKYCGINSKGGERVAMIDKRDAETLNLLKIDALGLRTLSILAEVCDTIGKPYSWIYELPVDDLKAYEVFAQQRYSGIFQFEGDAVKSLAKKMPIESIEDISALSALGRPGPLGSGAAWDYVNARAGREPIKWISEHHAVKEATQETYGVIIYQEQVMKIAREAAAFSWEDTGALRKVIAKTKKEEIQKFQEIFLDQFSGGREDAAHIWENIETFGGYAFNKSHSVSYGLISYYCAYFKAHYPLEFTQACLNHAKDDNSAVKILRDAVENEGIEYKHIDCENSMQKWTVRKGKLFGGFLSIKGIGVANANKIVKLRKEGKPFPAGIQKHLDNDISPFKYLYPAKELYGEYYVKCVNDPVITIEMVKSNNGVFNFIGKLTDLKARDLNEAQFVNQRSGQYASGQTAYLILILEDDTDSIRCKIKASDYLRLGKDIAENGKVDEDWYIVCGKRINDWNIVFVENIRKITKDKKVAN